MPAHVNDDVEQLEGGGGGATGPEVSVKKSRKNLDSCIVEWRGKSYRCGRVREREREVNGGITRAGRQAAARE